MRRAGVVLAACVASIAGAIALGPGCTRDPGDTLRFMIWGSPEEIAVVGGFLDEFRRQNPDIQVRVEHAPSMGYREKLRILFLGGNPPDVMYLGESDLPTFARKGWLLNLDPFIERDRAEVEPEDFYTPVFARFRTDQGTFGISKDFASLVLYYNKDLFDKWDVPYPKPGWTWEDFLDTAKRLTHRTEQGQDYGFLLETWNEELFPWIWQAGGEVASEDPPAWLSGRPEHIDACAEALQFLSDLIWKHRVAPGPAVTKDQQGNALFLRGQAAMCTYGRWACMEFRKIKDFDWGVVELPRHRRRASTLFTVAYSIARDTRRPEAAWKLVKFLTGKQAQLEVAHSAQAIPARRSAATSPAFESPRAFAALGYPVASRPHTDAVAYGRFSPRFPGAAEAKDVFNRGLEPLWSAKDPRRRDARKLLLELQPRLEAIVAEHAAAE
ncbi:MAG: sugar ABC transporter substrate-binding protein [Planctomycetota bacterium]|nr:MAG: sugar ABC transporter substrate-binding protein [Planctomycetota bacterium]